MPVCLQKGQKVSLTKDNPGLTRVVVGIGWDINQYDTGTSFDLDSSAFLLTGAGKVSCAEDFVFYGNLKHPSGAVEHMGDNRTGAGEGDDEQIMIDLDRVPEQYDRVVMCVTIYQARERGQQFGMIQNSFIRLVDARNNQEICRYNLSESYDGATAVVFGEVYRRNGEWKFNAMGQPLQVGGIAELVEHFR